MKTIYSFVLDFQSYFFYQGWLLARSLEEKCGAAPSDIHIHFTAESNLELLNKFSKAGYQLHPLERFGDGKYCNKIAQISALAEQVHDIAVLLDTDMIAVSDLRPYFDSNHIRAKVVDCANPPIDTLREILTLSGISHVQEGCPTDSGDGLTLLGNCNGGLYIIPKSQLEVLGERWVHWATWLLNHSAPLRKVGKESHIDQVSFMLALHELNLPFRGLEANANFYVHFTGQHLYYDSHRPIALLHYHGTSLNVLGKIELPYVADESLHKIITQANQQIGEYFDNQLFWSYRYESWSERGSGVGSRGVNLAYKIDLMRSECIERASSVLDVGCGDVMGVRQFQLNAYTGIDVSPNAINIARLAMPSGQFVLGMDPAVEPADFVLCFEVAIHQKNFSDYVELIQYVSERTRRILIISGYEYSSSEIEANSMLAFHEPLSLSLRKTGFFDRIEMIGQHTDVSIFKCRPLNLNENSDFSNIAEY